RIRIRRLRARDRGRDDLRGHGCDAGGHHALPVWVLLRFSWLQAFLYFKQVFTTPINWLPGDECKDRHLHNEAVFLGHETCRLQHN
ncbi:MAG TPA: hypothetical protein VEL08_02565, partial [Chthoniobacterales bacterium]|nr:hypothetical protein [Chthoniobacterales bacterium]